MAEVRFQVPGMTCDHCVRAVQEEVGGVAGVVSVEVDLASKDVVVKTDGTTVPQKALADAVLEAGFEPAGLGA